MDIRDKARELFEAFELRCRDNETDFYALRDGSPQWMTDACMAAHGDFMPDDHRYQMIHDAAEAIADGTGTEDDVCADFAANAPSTYNADRLAWLSSNLNRAGYCDEAAENGFVEADAGIFERIGGGQYVEAEEVFWQLMRALAGDES